mgnify:FL=1
MNAQAAVEIINEIATRLGVAAGYIIPELARVEIAQDAVLLVVFLNALIISVMYLKSKRVKEAFGDHNDDCIGEVLAFFASIALLAAFIALTLCMHDLVGWIASPTAKTIMYVVGMMK